VQRLTYAFRFISACFSLAVKYSRLRKPWFHLWMGGIALLILWLIPLGAVIAVLGLNPVGMALIGLFIILLLFCLLAWGEVTALETCLAFDDQLWKALDLPGSSEHKRDFAHWQDVFLWVFVFPGLETIHRFNRIFLPTSADKLDWLSAAYLMLPVIALEDFKLREGIDRIKQLLTDRLLRFHPDLVGVRMVVGLIQWVLILGGGLLGTWVGFRLANPTDANLLSQLVALGVGTLLAGVLALLGVHISSFNRACYFTTLYQWALNVENARMTGDASHSAPPAILSQVMKTKNSSKKE